METEQFDLSGIKNVLEAAILASQEPLSLSAMGRLFDDEIEADLLRRVLEDLRADWAGRGVELVTVAGGWRFQTRTEVRKYLERMSAEKPPKYSRAVLETLAIIAYRQPVTRGDIEEIRGVAVSPGILKALEGRGWIDAVGQREVPGRPTLYATTKSFLNDLGLRSLQELPSLDDLGALVVQSTLPSIDANPAQTGESLAAADVNATLDDDEVMSALTRA